MIRRHRDRTPLDAHLDKATMLRMLQGEDLAGSDAAADHLAACTACRRLFERLDPLATLFASEAPAAAAIPPRVAMPPARWWDRLHLPQLRPRSAVAIGVPVATAAALALAFVAVPRSTPAQPRDQLAQLTSQIRLAAARHDTGELHRLLAQTSTVLRHLDTGSQNSSLHGALTDLRDVLQALPPDPEAAAVVDQVDAADADADDTSPSPSPEATDTNTPAPTNAAAPEASPGNTPAPTDAPPPDATPAPTLAPDMGAATPPATASAAGTAYVAQTEGVTTF